MKIKKYNEFKQQLINDYELILEGDSDETTETDNNEEQPYNDSPESYIKGALKKLKNKLDSLFDDNVSYDYIENKESADDIIGPDFTDRTKREKTSDEDKMTLKDMGYKLESSDILKGTKTHKMLVIKFSDDTYYYSVYIKVSLKEAIKLINSGEELTDDSVQKAYIKMKKITLEGFEEVGTVNRNVMLGDIDENYIIELKLQLDEDFGSENDDKEEFSIET